MPTIPKRVQIELNSLVDGYPILSLYQSGGAKWDDDHLSLSSYDGAMHVMLSIRDAHAAREYAQMLRGAADALLDWALTQEQPQNFAAAEDAQAKHDVTTPGTRQWSTEERARLRVWGFVPDKLTLAGEEYALKLLAAAEVAK